MMEPDNVNGTPSHDFTLVADCCHLGSGSSRNDDLRQSVLAKRGQTEHIQGGSLSKRPELCTSVRQSNAASSSRDESGFPCSSADANWRRQMRLAISRWPEITDDMRQREMMRAPSKMRANHRRASRAPSKSRLREVGVLPSFSSRYCCGAASNLVRQPAEQKW